MREHLYNETSAKKEDAKDLLLQMKEYMEGMELDKVYGPNEVPQGVYMPPPYDQILKELGLDS